MAVWGSSTYGYLEMSDQPAARTRRGKGRPRHVPPLRKCHINLTDEQIRVLRMWGRGDVSAGLRWLIAAAAPLIGKPGD